MLERILKARSAILRFVRGLSSQTEPAPWQIEESPAGYRVGGLAIRREDIVAVEAFKRDLLAIDQTCLNIVFEQSSPRGNTHSMTLTEDDPMYESVLADLAKHFRLKQGWRKEVAVPAYQSKSITLWRRDH